MESAPGDEANMPNKTGHKTEEDVAPNFWKWVIVALCVIVLLALAAAGIFYYAHGRKENLQPSGVPQAPLFPIRAEEAIDKPSLREPSLHSAANRCLCDPSSTTTNE